MLRSVPIRLYAALLALAAILLLASVPTLGRTLSSPGVAQAAVEAGQLARDGASAEHVHHRSSAFEAEGAPAHSTDDCTYCLLLGSLAHSAASGAEMAMLHAARTPVGRVRAAPANTHPLSTLGSRGPPGDTA